MIWLLTVSTLMYNPNWPISSQTKFIPLLRHLHDFFLLPTMSFPLVFLWLTLVSYSGLRLNVNSSERSYPATTKVLSLKSHHFILILFMAPTTIQHFLFTCLLSLLSVDFKLHDSRNIVNFVCHFITRTRNNLAKKLL